MNPELQIKEITKYVCTDGKEFSSKQCALEYQWQINYVKIANVKFQEGETLFDSLLTLLPKINIPDNFKLITKGTGIKISHWQCSEKPVYKASRIDNDLNIFVSGYIDKYRGGYGESVKFSDLERYIDNTTNLASRGIQMEEG